MARRKSNDSKSNSAAPSSSSSWQNLRMSQASRQLSDQVYTESASGSNVPSYRNDSPEQIHSSSSTSTTAHRPFLQPTATSSNSIASSIGGAGESSGAQHDVSASSSSSSSASITIQAKSSRARVSMACIHCRSRKIRCDGSQPTCSTCFRLGRVCTYESITELENIMARDKKKRSKEAKRARLTSYGELGVPVPSRSVSMSSSGSQQLPPYTRSVSGGSGSTTSAQRLHGATAVGVIRDSRLARQGRSKPYTPQQHQSYNSQDSKQEDQYVSQQHLAPPQRTEQMLSSSHRKRGVTLDSFPTASPDLQQDQLRPNTNTSINVTSLSQPATPDAAYSSIHASIPSRGLSTAQDELQAETRQERPYTASGVGRQDAHDYCLSVHPPSTTLASDESLPYRPDQYVSEMDYTVPSTAFTSAVPSATSRSSVGDSTLANSFHSTIYPPGASPSTMNRSIGDQTDLEQQLAIRRRSSFDVGDFWRRGSVADAAVGNFFDRVVQSRGTKRGEEGTLGTMTSTSNRATYGYAPSLVTQQQPETHQEEHEDQFRTQGSYGSSMTATPLMPSGTVEDAYYPTYSNLQEVMMNTVPLDTPYTTLTSNTTPLTFQHPFALATSEGDQPQIHAPSRSTDGNENQTLEAYQNVSAAQYGSQVYSPSMYHQAPQSIMSNTSSIPALPSPSSSTSSTSFSRLRVYNQQQQQHSQTYQTSSDVSSSSMNAPSFSNASRSGQRAPPPHQLDLGNLANFDSHRQSQSMHTDGSTSTYATADSVYSPHPHHHRLVSTGTPSSASYGSINLPPSAGPCFTATSSSPNTGGMSGGGLGAAPPLPTPMTELSSNMMSMAPPSHYMVSPSVLTRSQGGRGSGDGGAVGESGADNDPYHPHQEGPYQQQQRHNDQHWQ